MEGKNKMLGKDTPMYQLFQKMLLLKRLQQPNLSLRDITFGAHSINSYYSRATYEGVVLGRRTGSKELWEAIYQSMDFTPVEKFLINSTWMVRKLLQDIELYGLEAPTKLYITEYVGLSVCFAYQVDASSEPLDLIDVDAYYILQGQLKDVLVFFINQNKGMYPFQTEEIPKELQEYETVIRVKQEEKWK